MHEILSKEFNVAADGDVYRYDAWFTASIDSNRSDSTNVRTFMDGVLRFGDYINKNNCSYGAYANCFRTMKLLEKVEDAVIKALPCVECVSFRYNERSDTGTAVGLQMRVVVRLVVPRDVKNDDEYSAAMMKDMYRMQQDAKLRTVKKWFGYPSNESNMFSNSDCAEYVKNILMCTLRDVTKFNVSAMSHKMLLNTPSDDVQNVTRVWPIYPKNSYYFPGGVNLAANKMFGPRHNVCYFEDNIRVAHLMKTFLYFPMYSNDALLNLSKKNYRSVKDVKLSNYELARCMSIEQLHYLIEHFDDII